MIKNRFHSYVKKKENLSVLLYILQDLEQSGPIETFSDEILDEFKIFMPNEKLSRDQL